ncbi:uncharacterized protein LOC134311403 isoform X2 [Trichomycterus rosablanca]|uniref:uncharacterized protein LOC134311403 isoform X2 n=1 Tax=Trichomycterus rosablanca TaxID=2290929 RepID=UPI002F35E16A
MFWFKKLRCCSVLSDEDEEPHRPKPEKKEKKKKWWQRLKKKDRQEDTNVEEHQMMGNEENAGMSTQVLQDQGQEPEVQVIEIEEKNQVEPSKEENRMMGNEVNVGMSTQVLPDPEVQVVQMEEKNPVEPSMEKKNMEEKKPEEQNPVIEGIEDPLQAVLEKIFRSSDEVVQQQNVQDEHVLIAPTFITQLEECEKLMKTTMENQGMLDPAGAPVSPLSMLKLKRTSRWTERPVMVLPSSQYVSSALLCSAALWRPSERPRSTGIVQKFFLHQNTN